MLRFVVVLAGCMVAFNAFFYVYLTKAAAFEWYLGLNAELSAAILRLLGDEAKTSGTSIISPRFSLAIRTGCDAIQASAFFILIVLASPVSASASARLPSLLVGTLLLLILNLARIVSLYYVGVYFSGAFNTMHVEVWQPIFIFLPLCFWLVWLRGAMRGTATGHHAAH